MVRLHCVLVLVVFSISELTAGPAASAATFGPELLQSPGFVNRQGTALAENWTIWRPEWKPSQLIVEPSQAGVRFKASDDPFAVGGMSQSIEGIIGSKSYSVSAQCELSRVANPESVVLVRVEWMKQGRALHPAGLLVQGPVLQEAAASFSDILEAPADADGARLSLEVKWPRDGSVLWKQASFRVTDSPAPRTVKIGTVYLRPRDSTPERNLDLWCEQIDAAGKLRLDIVCLSEAILLVGTQVKASAVAEAIPGPATDRLGAAARRNQLWVVAGLMEHEGNRLFNTAVLLDRQGKLAGKYRKVHLPREEWKKGITPGNDYPAFETDFGTIGIQICYDYFFPEPARILAQRGAEILFAPTWGTTFEDKDGRAEGQTVFRARARDNGLYLVPSVYDGNSLVIDPLGRILASSNGQTGVFWTAVDLNQREPLWWVGHWRSIGPRHRMPDTYTR